MRYYSYESFKTDMETLVCKLDFNPDGIVAISRGGLTMAHFLGIALDLRKIYTINAISFVNKIQQELQVSNIPELRDNSKILIVDEIIDSGTSMERVLSILKNINPNIEFKTAVIFAKKNARIQPDYFIQEAKEWIEFFWEVDILKSLRERRES
ncbi:phosphoribosyltransferase [Helicobacter apodemus]|uniref:Phosphoribosyltransferase n=1 Tax=Helicobacter apodemus TaxID=135569 RepID=A0A4U8UGM7_9HELI|nr:phosphoribosyltransferase family protein [Helicobacter apodemus]TLE13377.1 phosphoribosyltransferase [Helicobacter apodemus]